MQLRRKKLGLTSFLFLKDTSVIRSKNFGFSKKEVCISKVSPPELSLVKRL